MNSFLPSSTQKRLDNLMDYTLNNNNTLILMAKQKTQNKKTQMVKVTIFVFNRYAIKSISGEI